MFFLYGIFTIFVLYTNVQATCNWLDRQCVNGMCQQLVNQQFQCTCNPGYIADPVDPLLCHPVPPCNLIPGTPDQQCLYGLCQMQSNGYYGCNCLRGYKLSFANPNICENVNECLLPNNGCAQGSCADLAGDYICTSCPPGSTLDRYGKCQVQYHQHYQQPPPAQQSSSDPLLYAWLFDSWIF